MVISDEVLEVARLDPQGRAQSGGCLAYVHARGRLPFDVVCFHAQQCAEKYPKALLVFHGLEVPRTHDLTEILRLLPAGLVVSLDLDELAELNSYTVDFRYPGLGLDGFAGPVPGSLRRKGKCGTSRDTLWDAGFRLRLRIPRMVGSSSCTPAGGGQTRGGPAPTARPAGRASPPPRSGLQSASRWATPRRSTPAAPTSPAVR